MDFLLYIELRDCTMLMMVYKVIQFGYECVLSLMMGVLYEIRFSL